MSVTCEIICTLVDNRGKTLPDPVDMTVGKMLYLFSRIWRGRPVGSGGLLVVVGEVRSHEKYIRKLIFNDN